MVHIMANTDDTPAQLLGEWRGQLKSFMLSKSLMGIPTMTDLLEQLDDIITVLDLPTGGGLTLSKLHPIDRLGCGLSVLSMYCDGMDTASISKVIHTQTGEDISTSEVQQWIDNYEASGVVRRSTMSNLSIFDTKNRMEDIYLNLQKIQADIEMAPPEEFSRAKTTRYDVQLAAASQMRAAAKDARQVVEALHQMNTYAELASIIVEEIKKESPAVAQRVYKILRQKGALVKAILPSS